MIQEIKEELAECNPEALLADGFEAALVGIARVFNKYLAVYDYDKCIDVLTAQGLSREEAVEHMEFNVVGPYVGENTPVFLRRPALW